MAVVYAVNQKSCKKNLLGFSTDQDVKWIYSSISTLCLSYLFAKGIQSVMGAKSLKINWKVESLMTGAGLATFFLAGSKRFPIYEA